MPADAFSVPAGLAERLTAIVGQVHVTVDEAACAAMAEDIYARGTPPGLIVAPGSTDELARTVEAATTAGRAVVPRGGGMSYTSGYLAETAGAVLVDLRRMNRVIDVNPQDMTVTVEAGCTWADLLAALQPHRLRTPFWGALSGISSTIGGGLSQLNAFFGAGVWGTTSESVTCLAVVLADGSVLRTGSAGTVGGSPFYRHYGPDLAGLFMGDCGALGIKAEVTLRLVPAPRHEAWASFSFDTSAAAARAQSDIARTGLACEVCGFDPGLARIRMRRASLIADVKTLAAVVTSQKSLLSGLKEGAKMALAGRGFLEEGDWSLHVTVEGDSKAGVEDGIERLRHILRGHGGKETDNTIPKAMRAAPFTPLNNVLGPDGQRWVPIHGIVPLSAGEACLAEIEALFASRRAELDAHQILTGFLLTTLATNGFLIEPVFFWPDSRYGLHEATVEPGYLAKLPVLQTNREAAAAVESCRQAILDIFGRHGATHFQIGRTYRYAQSREPVTLALLQAIKRTLDPQGLMNPGALGL
jgi:D-lactate dehydrogenase (cytochrome)